MSTATFLHCRSFTKRAACLSRIAGVPKNAGQAELKMLVVRNGDKRRITEAGHRCGSRDWKFRGKY